MIFRITEKNKHLFEDVFNEHGELVSKGFFSQATDAFRAVDCLGEDEIIKDIPSYFAALQKYAMEKGGDVLQNVAIMRVPPDEPRFTIDADSRTITIPPVWDTNGIGTLGVVGDEAAEVVFFEIDRFFDGVDLSTCNCEIEWRNSIAMTNPNAPGAITARSYGLWKDFDDSKVIFGWVVSSDMTKIAGQVQFAVRLTQFVTEKDEDGNDYQKLVFNFNTQPAYIQIKGGLGLDYDSTKTEKYDTLWKSRSAVYSGVVNNSWGALPFIEVDLPVFANLDELNKWIFEVTAKSPDKGQLIYIWYKDGKAQNTEDEGKADGMHQFTADIAGSYMVKVGNLSPGYDVARYRESQTCIIPNAEQVYINEMLPVSKGYATIVEPEDGESLLRIEQLEVKASAENGTISYQWYKDGEKIDGATAAIYRVPDAASAQGEYYVEVRNDLNNTHTEASSVTLPILLMAWPKVVGNDEITIVPYTGPNFEKGYKCVVDDDEQFGRPYDGLEYIWEYTTVDANNVPTSHRVEKSNQTDIFIPDASMSDMSYVSVYVRQGKFKNYGDLYRFSKWTRSDPFAVVTE